MKKLFTLLIALVLLLGATTALAEAKTIGFYADNVDSYYAAITDVLKALLAADPDTADWQVDVVTGTGSAAEQLNAVQNFITAGYDAVAVIQNNVETSSECIQMAVDAGIPYFGMTHSFGSAANALDAAAWIGYDFTLEGELAGQNALLWGAKKVVNIEGVLGQGSAGAQSLGFIQAYEKAGADLGGWTAADMATQKPTEGGAGLSIVQWTSGGWMKDSAKTAMSDIIVALGADGFDGVYAQNNPMMEGVIEAMEEAGLDTADYWLGSGNGREISWDWVKNGVIDCDVNQSALLEGDALYQILKSYFAGETYRKYIHPVLNEYDYTNIDEMYDKLVPFTDVDAYLAKRAANTIVFDINDTEFFKDALDFIK